MSGWLLAIVGVIYLAVALEQAIKGNMGLALTFAAYAVSNVGLMLAAK